MNNLNENTGLRGFYTLSIKRADGTPKQLFQYNSFGFWLQKTLGLSLDIPYVTGSWSSSFQTENTIVNAGLAEVAKLIGGVGTPSEFTYLALGSSSTAVTNTDTALGTELTTDGLARVSVTPTSVTTTVTDDSVRLNNEFTFTGSTTTNIEELGVFNAASAGDMLSRSLTGGKTVDTNGETIDVTYTLVADRA